MCVCVCVVCLYVIHTLGAEPGVMALAFSHVCFWCLPLHAAQLLALVLTLVPALALMPLPASMGLPPGAAGNGGCATVATVAGVA